MTTEFIVRTGTLGVILGILVSLIMHETINNFFTIIATIYTFAFITPLIIWTIINLIEIIIEKRT